MTLPIEGRVRVVVDVDTVFTDDDQARFLFALLAQDQVETFKYSDQGPPPEQPRRSVEPLRLSVTPGWLTFAPAREPTWDDQGRVTYTTGGDSWHASNVMGGGDFLEWGAFLATERLGDRAPDGQQIRSDLTTLLAVSAAKAHLFVTNRPVLLEPNLPRSAYSCTAADVEDSLATISLWLRAKGVYIVLAEGRGKALVERHTFYMIALRNLLHESWRWGHGCTASGDPVLHDLSISLHRRLVTALKARDRIRTAGFFMAQAASRDEVLECVDVIALNVMAAFDVVARAANRVLRVVPKDKNASWLYPNWSDNLPRPGLGSIIDRHREVVLLISRLRNTIHEKAMHLGTIHQPQEGDADYYVVLPADQSEDLRASFETLGGLEAWGIRELGPERLWAEPFRLSEQMLRYGIYALDALLADIPIEHLAVGTALETGPPVDDWVWSATARRNVAWQVALREHEPADRSC
ncbi:hypothetical protein [Microlunatus antarcticus]|uniref:Uncharacterized protein n=1 Tax=Microlunatus antarcticus TaxID=53388 RepID=A0A7W5JST5_9ACTN|nr:hypothetical protein [Microlunatus antarcticus]MBB3325067.1 hypothetical protein [Microlunatus antarcticus]